MTPALIVIGTSLGGLQALTTLLAGLPPSFATPIAIVQHRTKESSDGLRQWLQKACQLLVGDVEDKESMQPGRVYLAPADYHLLVEADGFALSTEAPVWHARPAIDVLFETAASVYHERLIGVILTGSSQDGAEGLAAIKQRGGITIVQDPATAESPVMPEAARRATTIDALLPLEAIAPLLIQLCSATQR